MLQLWCLSILIVLMSATPSRSLITFVTGNANKAREVQQILGSRHQVIAHKLDLPELQGDPESIAKAKCEEASKYIAGPLMIEDTCLCFHALGGLPGPYIKDFLDRCGHEGLNQMLDGFDDRSAYAQTTIAYRCGAQGQIHLVVGRTDGTIVRPRGGAAFGWDPIFQVGDRTYAEMTANEKNAISHRRKALDALQVLLEELEEDAAE